MALAAPMRIRPRSQVGDAAWRQEAERRFEELTNLALGIQNDVDALVAPLQPAASAASAAAGATGGRVLLPLPSFAVSSALQDSIRKRLRQLHERMSALQSSAGDQDSAADKQHVLDALTKHLAIAEDLHTAFRRALLALQQHWSRPDNVLRDQLFDADSSGAAAGAGAMDPATRRRAMDAASAREKAGHVTDALHRARGMMHEEVKRAATALSRLKESTGAMQKVSDEYKAMGGAITTARQRISVLIARAFTDKVIFAAGLLFFATVCLYVLHKRVWPRVPTSLITYPLSFVLNTLFGAGGGGTALPPAAPPPLHAAGLPHVHTDL